MGSRVGFLSMASIPLEHRWVFWDVDPGRLDTEKSAHYLLARILEFGGIEEVRWPIGIYGLERIHAFLRDEGQVEISERTMRFWRALLHAEHETWADPGGWRRNIGAPWTG